MFKKIIRKICCNPFDKLLVVALKKKQKSFLIGWNRGIGDIPLGLFALVHRIKWFIPDSKITFMIRPSLKEGFLLFPQVKTIIAPTWQRNKSYSVKATLNDLKIPKDRYDVIIERPDPTYWVSYQLGRLKPSLTWNEAFDKYQENFGLSNEYNYIAVQPNSDTEHSPWRDFPEKKWRELFDILDMKKDIKVILFGVEKKGHFDNKCVLDLRGRTTLVDVLSIIKNRCFCAILPDGGILSLLYFLNIDFPITVVSLWSDLQGVLKQNVESPNKLLTHYPLVRSKLDFHDIMPDEILNKLAIDIKKQSFSCNYNKKSHVHFWGANLEIQN